MVHPGLALYLVFAAAQTESAKSTVIAEKQLTLHFANKDAKLYVATYSGSLPLEPHEKLLLKTGGKTSQVRQLGDLKGFVHIDDIPTALEYIRLQTFLTTWYLWHESQTVEIVDKTVANTLPDYGLRGGGAGHATSGFMGVLSNAAFKQGNFTAASVSITADAFIVKRWLLTIDGDKRTVDLVQEKVGHTGTYERVILKKGPAPQLSGTNWYIMKFE